MRWCVFNFAEGSKLLIRMIMSCRNITVVS